MRNISSSQATVPAASKTLIGIFELSIPGIGETIRRTVGVIGVSSDQTGGIEQQLGAVGYLVATSTALAAGVASLPGPVTERDDDGWFVWQSVIRRGDASLTSPVVEIFNYDSKAMRRVEEGYAVAVVAENSHATNGLLIHFSTSMYATRH